MNPRMIAALVAKDALWQLRNPFFLFISIASLILYTAIYLLLPDSIDTTLSIGIYAPDGETSIETALQAFGFEPIRFESEQALRDAIEAKEYRVGLALPAGVDAIVATGQPTELIVYYPPGAIPEETQIITDTLNLVFSQVRQSDITAPINWDVTLMGFELPDSEPLALRDRLLPIFAILLFLTETLALANLVADEIARGTIRALLITPLSISGLFISKAITGIGLSFGQAALFLLIAGGFSQQPVIVLLTLLLGALLITGVSFLIASVSHDMMSVISWGMLALIALGLPSTVVLLPGLLADWVKLIPTYYLVDTLHRVMNFNADWSSIGSNLAILVIVSAAMMSLGITVLRRRLA